MPVMKQSATNFFLRPHTRPIIIAHRGASGDAPENTLAAFREAIRQKADAIELDVQHTRDRKLVILHDPWLQRATNGRGLVGSKTLAEIKQLDAGSSFSSKFAGEPVPTLEEVLDKFGTTTHYIIELKFYQMSPNKLVNQAFEAVAKRKLLDYVLFLSFDSRILTQLKQLNPRAATAWAFFPVFGWMPSRRRADRYDVLAIALKSANPRYIDRLKALDKPVSLWMGSHEDYDREIGAEADYLTTNHPDELREALEQKT